MYIAASTGDPRNVLYFLSTEVETQIVREEKKTRAKEHQITITSCGPTTAGPIRNKDLQNTVLDCGGKTSCYNWPLCCWRVYSGRAVLGFEWTVRTHNSLY